MNIEKRLAQPVVNAYPQSQAIYLFGSWGTEHEWRASDVDLALLLPPEQAKEVGSLMLSDLHVALQSILNKDVDLINLRQVNTVFQKEIVITGQRIFCANALAADEFEMLALSLYQKLNQERADGLRSGKFYNI